MVQAWGGSLHEFCSGHAELVLEGQQCSETVDHATGHGGFMLRAETRDGDLGVSSLEMADEVGPYDSRSKKK